VNYFRCKCGCAAFCIEFEKTENEEIGPVVLLHCWNVTCKLIHRVQIGSEWLKTFPQQQVFERKTENSGLD
jgi:hypothetical protein